MNTKAAEPAAVAPVPAHERGSVAYLVGAIALVAVVAVLIVIFGVVRPPALPSLDAAGVTPPGGVAWMQWDDRDSCSELMVARPDGSVDRLACEEDIGHPIAWTSDGIISLSWESSGPVLLTWNSTTGDVVGREAVTAGYGVSDASRVSSVHRDGNLVVTLDPGGRQVWTVQADREYRVDAGTLSPDGSWVVMVDSSERLLLVRLRGDGPAVWADGASVPWVPPVWEGTSLPGPAQDPKTST